MALSSKNVCDLYEGLKHNFLFNNDINCIHILLNLYDLEENIRNVFPKYVSTRTLRNHISRVLKKRRGNELIALNLSNLIHEDINRLELFLYLEGYKLGYVNIKGVNILEGLTLKHCAIEDLYNIKYLYHLETTNKDIKELRASINKELNNKEKEDKQLFDTIVNYASNVIRGKVFSLNKYLDKQLTIDYNSENFNIKEDETLLTKEDLTFIYREVLKIVLKNGFKLYKDAYWNGLNDRVLKRYR